MTKSKAESIIGDEIDLYYTEGVGWQAAANIESGVCAVIGKEKNEAAQRLVDEVYKRRSEIVRKTASYRCSNCGSPGPLEIDHINLRSRGRSDKIDNLRALCVPCHRRKHG